MSSQVTIRLNGDEEALILRAMAISGERKTATHIKRVYFENLNYEDNAINDISDSVSRIMLSVEYLKIIQEEEAKKNDKNGLMLTLLAGIYLMVRNSVSDKIRNKADEFIDYGAVESFLSEDE